MPTSQTPIRFVGGFTVYTHSCNIEDVLLYVLNFKNSF